MKIRFLVAALMLIPALVRADDLPDLGDVSQTAITPAQERALGESIMGQIRSSPGYLDDPEIADYLNTVGYKLVSSSPDPGGAFEFFGVADSTLNAFALPGGFIGVHSGLLLAAQTESELCGVLSHEISHVTQRHLARMVAAQQRAGLASMAAIAIAILAARSNSDASGAAIAAAMAAPIQSQLSFTRDHEREADRIGLQIMEKSGFDPRGMTAFFERMQKNTRVYETSAPSYLRTHPLTYERIADLENRIQNLPYRQVPDSVEFGLVRARLAALDGNPRDVVANFDASIASRKFASEAAARYGLVTALLRAGDVRRARKELDTLLALGVRSFMIDALTARVYIASGDVERGLTVYQEASRTSPGSRALVYGYAEALIGAKRPRDAAAFLSSRLESRPADARLYELLARAYTMDGKRLLQHQAQAEVYVLRGNLAGAVEQLQIAQRAGDGDFYQKSSVEARLKELMAADQANRRKP
jgi:beta-barrel assembly-enhancing protease